MPMKKTDSLRKSSLSLRSAPTWSTIDSFESKAPSEHKNHTSDTTATKAHGEEEQEVRRNPVTGLPLRNTSPYGRHSNDWLFGSVKVRDTIKKVVGGSGDKSTKSDKKQ